VEPGEVEAVLQSLDGVRAAAVVAHETANGPRLEAWAVSDAPRERLRDALAERLPAFMLPSRIQLTGALPLTPNGKIDRAALRSGDEDRPMTGALSVLLGAEEIDLDRDLLAL